LGRKIFASGRKTFAPSAEAIKVLEREHERLAE
jgi:hypothetical protein